MAVVDQKWSALPVPYAMEHPDRVPKERYFDPDFYAMEVEQLWPRVWQMACRLEEIPQPRDFVEYEFLDQSVVVVRTDDMGVTAFQNACRHRGVRSSRAAGRASAGSGARSTAGATGPTARTPRSRSGGRSPSTTWWQDDLDLMPVRCEMWGGCAWINFDDDAPPVRAVPRAGGHHLDAWKVESMRAEKWYACRLPVNWKLAIEAFVEMYHVVQTHPQLVIPARFGLREDAPFDPQAFIDSDIQYLRAMSDGMDGMCHADDVRIAESLRDVELPADAVAGDGHVEPHAQRRGRCAGTATRGHDIPDLNELDEQGINLTFFHGFPHYFVLPMYSSASAYRFRPLGPEETLMEIWSLARFPEGRGARAAHAARGVGVRRSPLAGDPRAGLLEPPAAAEGSAREGLRVHAPVAAGSRGTSRTSNGPSTASSPVFPTSGCSRRWQSVNVYPFEQPMLDLGF